LLRIRLLAHGGFNEALYENLERPVEAILEAELADAASIEYFGHYRVAVVGERVAGGLSAFPFDSENPAADHPELPVERLALEAPFDTITAPGSYFIHAVTVFAEFARRGIGSMLMDEARRQALDGGFRVMSLYVFAQNDAAVALYRKHGFIEAGRSQLVPHPRLQYSGDVLLMTCSL
jgi:ribosomal protein S18 acetylase RimI-like enzyme